MKRAPLPARWPPGPWPAQMRADMVAAYLDYRDTLELRKAVLKGEVPQPSGYHGAGRSREPVWAKDTLDSHAAPSRAVEDPISENLAALV